MLSFSCRWLLTIWERSTRIFQKGWRLLLDEIENKLNLLCEFPGLGAELSDPYLVRKGYRRLLVDNYLIFYLIDEIERKIIVMRILYGARDYQDIL